MVNCPDPFSINAKTPVTFALSIILTMAGSVFTLLGEQANRTIPNANKKEAILNIIVALMRSTKLPHNTNKNTPNFGGVITILTAFIQFLKALHQILG